MDWKLAFFLLSVNARGGRGNSYRGLCIHVPARVMGQFAIFCPGYRSCFVNLALVMGSALQKFALVMVNASNS